MKNHQERAIEEVVRASSGESLWASLRFVQGELVRLERLCSWSGETRKRHDTWLGWAVDELSENMTGEGRSSLVEVRRMQLEALEAIATTLTLARSLPGVGQPALASWTEDAVRYEVSHAQHGACWLEIPRRSASQGSGWRILPRAHEDSQTSPTAVPSPPAVAPPSRFEHRRHLDENGFWVACVAWDTLHHREITLIRSASEPTDAAVEEGARLLRRIDSPHVFPLRESGRDGDNRAFAALDAIAGPTLLDAAQGGALRCEQATRVVEQIAGALAAVDAAGGRWSALHPLQVHLHGERGDVRIFFPEAFGTGAPSHLPLGRLRYWPVLDPEPTSEAGRVWVLGAFLSVALTGEDPFDGQTLAEVALQMKKGIRRPITGRRAGDARLAAIEQLLGRCLSPEPPQRPAHAALLAKLSSLSRG